ncbi:MAG TPA: ferredoxin reductase family protein [Streptosporangiaceae bacterium]|nr:ferredoxin reductase family protein [Streptosporangiaceae bacterium]
MSASPVAFGVSRPSAGRNRKREPARGPGGPRPHPAVARVALAAAGLGLGVTTALTFTAESASQLAAPGGLATFAGSMAGMIGTYLALIMVLLVSRIPVIERVAGQDGLIRLHRMIAPWPISLLAAHALLLTVGYAQAARTGLWHEAGTLLTYPDVLIAAVALAIMVVIGVISVRAIRMRLPRDTWWAIHLWMYLALALAFPHEIVLGPSFVGHPLARVVWSAVWAATAGLVLCYRIGLPILRTVRHQLTVVEVRPEGPGVVSVICAGRKLDKLACSGGQFFCWRFLAPGMWWQAHPFSLSALPQPPYLRLTVKGVGGYTRALAQLRPGTKVAIEGPYGAFTRYAQRRPRALLVAAGIGVTALRSLLEDLPRGSGPVVLLRGRRPEDLVLSAEVRELVRVRGGSLHEVTGPRDRAAIDAVSLPRLVRDLDQRDVYVCGPERFVADITALARYLGVPDDAIHHEAFAL